MKTSVRLKSLIFSTDSDNKIIVLRLLVGLVFISEGIQKFLFLEILGPGLFKELGFSNAFFWAYFTGSFEILCGSLVIAGFVTRIACLPLLVIMATAFFTTKLPTLATRGLWSFLHLNSLDFVIDVLLILILLAGAGKWSIDHKYSCSLNKHASP